MDKSPPESILIIGAGVFGLSTAWALTKRPAFAKTIITVLDDCTGQFPPADSASVDSSRIIRADYADRHYTALAATAQEEWRKQGEDDLGGQGRYFESGFVLMADETHQSAPGKKTGMDYTKQSWENVAKISEQNGWPSSKIQPLESPEALRKHLGMRGHPGDWGYLNELSGWADAGKAMAWLFDKVKATGKVNFLDGKAEELLTQGNRVIGARLSNGTIETGSVVLVAAGAWSGYLVDLRGRVEATGHALGYVEITDEEAASLARQPVVLHLTSGLFVIPPKGRMLKVARHSFGYINPTTISTALPLTPESERGVIVASQPMTSRTRAITQLPQEADRDLRRALAELVPIEGLECRPWKETRLCWYSDTRDGDWLIDWHPGWDGLFIATGDSGHGFKFLPVLGDKILDCMLGQGGDLGQKWKWKEADDGVGREVEGEYQGLVTEDGSRGSCPSMVLMDELRN